MEARTFLGRCSAAV